MKLIRNVKKLDNFYNIVYLKQIIKLKKEKPTEEKPPKPINKIYGKVFKTKNFRNLLEIIRMLKTAAGT